MRGILSRLIQACTAVDDRGNRTHYRSPNELVDAQCAHRGRHLVKTGKRTYRAHDRKR